MGSDDIKHLVAGISWENERKPDGLRHYAIKYALKMYQKIVPEDYRNVGRFWGRSRNITCTPTAVIATDSAQLWESLAKWGYRPAPGVPLYRVLYNASKYYNGPAVPSPRPVTDFDSDPDSW